jgi:hypothetical protein
MKIDILSYRLYNQRLSQTEFTSPADVVSWFGAVQAQDYAAAKWALGQRMKNATEAEIDRAFDEGKILRTHVMRPTWHFVAPTDIRWLLKLTAARVHAANGYQYRALEIDPALMNRSQTVMEKALRGGKYLTRDEIAEALAQAGISPKIQLKVTYLVLSSELDGLLCSGPRRGKQFTYALLEERVPPGRDLDRGEALAELTRRYFASHGPATLQDFVWWSGLTNTDAKSALEMVRRELSSEIIAAQTYWFKDVGTVAREKPPAIHLLPDYDEYGVGYTDRSLIYDASHDGHLDARGSFLAQYSLVIDGQIMGTWKRTLKKNSVAIEVVPFRDLKKSETKPCIEAGERYGKFLRLPVLFLFQEHPGEQRKSRSV